MFDNLTTRELFNQNFSHIPAYIKAMKAYDLLLGGVNIETKDFRDSFGKYIEVYGGVNPQIHESFEEIWLKMWLSNFHLALRVLEEVPYATGIIHLDFLTKDDGETLDKLSNHLLSYQTGERGGAYYISSISVREEYEEPVRKLGSRIFLSVSLRERATGNIILTFKMAFPNDICEDDGSAFRIDYHEENK